MKTQEELYKEIEEVPFGVCEWGSCQYSSAQAMFDKLEEVSKEEKGMEQTLARFGISISLRKVSPEDAVKEFKKVIKERDLKEDDEFWVDDPEGREERLRFLETVWEGGGMFDYCRTSAWDLWYTAPYVAKIVGLEVIEAPEAPGVGPIMNVMVQNENYKVGALCWLLYRSKVVANKEAFANFDT